MHISFRKIRRKIICIIAGTLAASLLLSAAVFAETSETEDTSDYTRELAKRSQSSEPEDAVLKVSENTVKNEEKTHTVMIYMVGSNLESRLGSATKDIDEMTQAGLGYEDVNVILYTGGSRRWVGEVPCDRNCVIDLSKPADTKVVASTERNANMGSPESLTNFINFCSEYYPAEHNSLIFWDHGGGPLWGYGSDELFDSDSLLLSELKSAMEATEYGEDNKLDIVGFDACLMASLENMMLWQPFADYYIASEELEPGNGWDYAFLKAFEETSDPEEIGRAVVDRYRAFYDNARTQTSNPDITLSLTDLSGMPKISEALNTLAGTMTDDLSGGAYASIIQKRAASKNFGLAENAKGYISYYYDLVDICDLCGKLSELYPKESEDLIQAVNDAVIYNTANVECAGGISLYFPFRNKTQYSQMKVVYQDVAAAPNYTRFLSRNATQWQKSRGRDWKLGELVDSGDEYTLQLTDEQVNNITGADVSILALSPAGGYVPYLSSVKIEPDKNGVLHIKKSIPMVALRSDNNEFMVWPVSQIDSDDSRIVYKTEETGLRSDVSYINHVTDMDRERISVTLSMDKTTDEVQILSVSSNEETDLLGGKNTVEIDHWEELYFYQYPAYTTKDQSGSVLPFRDWSATGVVSWSDMPVDRGFSFEMIASEDTGLDLFCQVQITDTNGENYASIPAAMSKSDDYREVIMDTPKGELVFAVYPDHASVIDYNGRDRELIVPESVEEVPVTSIGDSAFGKMTYFSSTGTFIFENVTLPDTIERIGANAFYSCTKLKNVNMPAALKSIGSLAFYNCRSLEEITVPEGTLNIGKSAFAYCSALKTINLPAGIETIGTGVLMGCSALQTISLPETCAGYTTIDGTLFTSDGTVFLAYPAARGEELVVPEGTKRIAYGACAASSLKNVYLPESLEYIDNFAFYSCNELQAPTLPDGLLEIGFHAFDTYQMAFDPEDLPDEVQNIHIGSALSWIGDHAFDGFVLKSITVSEENTRYTSSGGVLMNGAGDSVIALTVDGNGQIIIPEGTVAFDFEMLEFLDSINELSSNSLRRVYLPESLQRFPQEVNEYEYRNLFFHCAKGSAAEQFLLANNIPYSSEMSSDYTVSEITTDAGVITARIYEDYAMIVKFTGEGELLELPAEVEGRPVRVVGDGRQPVSVNGYYYSFNTSVSETPNLTKVIIPEGVEELSAKALSGFSWQNNVTVDLPSTLKSIGSEALTGCKEIVLPEGIERIGKNFTDSELKEGFTLTPSITFIDPQAFASCYGFSGFKSKGENETYKVIDGALYTADGTVLLSYPSYGNKQYSVAEGTEKIGAHAFDNSWAIESIEFPATLRVIDEGAFYGCWHLKEVTFTGEIVDLIARDAFRFCSSLESIKLPLVKEIGESAFASCSMLSEVSFTQGLRSIGSYAFSDTNIGDPALPDSVRQVGNYAFYSYDGVLRENAPEKLHIGIHATAIGTEAFQNIGAKEFEVDPANGYYASADGFLTDKAGNTLIVAPSGMEGEVFVPKGITAIASSAFTGAKGITKLHIPDTVEYISSVNFETVKMTDENGNETEGYPVTIYCKYDSYAHYYALENGIPYVLEFRADDY